MALKVGSSSSILHWKLAVQTWFVTMQPKRRKLPLILKLMYISIYVIIIPAHTFIPSEHLCTARYLIYHQERLGLSARRTGAWCYYFKTHKLLCKNVQLTECCWSLLSIISHEVQRIVDTVVPPILQLLRTFLLIDLHIIIGSYQGLCDKHLGIFIRLEVNKKYLSRICFQKDGGVTKAF